MPPAANRVSIPDLHTTGVCKCPGRRPGSFWTPFRSFGPNRAKARAPLREVPGLPRICIRSCLLEAACQNWDLAGCGDGGGIAAPSRLVARQQRPLQETNTTTTHPLCPADPQGIGRGKVRTINSSPGPGGCVRMLSAFSGPLPGCTNTLRAGRTIRRRAFLCR
jgi:hypothetical protein